MSATFNSAADFFFPFAPVASTSADAPPPSATPTAAPSHTQPQQSPQPYTGTFAGKKLSCITCRKGKAKCIWIDGTDSCELCLKRGLICPGSAAPQRKSRSPDLDSPVLSRTAPSDGAVDWTAVQAVLQQGLARLSPAGSIHSLGTASIALAPHSASPAYSQSQTFVPYPTHTRPAFSPYHTAAGRPRVLGPSSSEGSLNAIARAGLLKTELVQLYTRLWTLQFYSWPTNTFSDLLNSAVPDAASRAMLSIAVAGGARSSPHSELLGQLGPPLRAVDEDVDGQLSPGGFSQWGLRRHGASVSLARKAIQETTLLLQRAPTVRSLTVALAASRLYNTIYGDRAVMRPFVLVVIEAWRAARASGATTEEEHAWLESRAGPALLQTDCLFSLARGGPLALTDEEVHAILATCEDTAALECYGIPAVAGSGDRVVVYDESLIYRAHFNTELALLHSLAHVFGNGRQEAAFNSLALASLGSVQDMLDGIRQPLFERLAQLDTVDEGCVFVAHDWTGLWRPASMKEHAIVIVDEVIQDTFRLDVHIYGRLALEHTRGRIALDPLATADVLSLGRERARRAIKFLAQSVKRLLPTPRKHATWANAFIHLVTAVSWVDLVLGRHGEQDGPLATQDELTLDEIELLVRAFRVGSYTQSTLAVPLRELEAGLESLRARMGVSVEDGLSYNFAGL